jgi:NitT/TauT family transport system permease protein
MASYGLYDLDASVPRRPGFGRRLRSRLFSRKNVLLRLMQVGFFGLVLLIWWGATSLHLIKPLVSRTPAQVWHFTWAAWRSGAIPDALASTVEATLIAFVLASVVGVIVGIALGLMSTVEKVVNPFLDALNSMPRIAFGPVFILYFGITPQAKIALAFTVVVFILIYNARAGIRSADPDVLRLAQTLGISRIQRFFKILLPVAVPSIFAGLKLGMIYSLLGVVTSEIIASRVGLGQLINSYSQTFRMEGVYGILIILGAIGLVLNSIMVGVETWILRWQAPQDR